MDALKQAISQFKRPANLARAAGVSPQVISNAMRRGRVSPNLAQAIERATGGLVSKDALVWGIGAGKNS